MTKPDRLLPIIGPLPLTPEWDAAHLTHITGSRAGAVCGVSEYSTLYHLYLELTGAVGPFEGNDATRRGQFYEPAILADYCLTRGVEITAPLPMFFHPTIPYLAATPDARVLGSEWESGRLLVEAKWSLSAKRAAQLGEEGSDDVPDDWMMQVQAEMDSAVAEVCDIPVLLFGRLKIYRVVRNEDLIDLYHDAAAELWQRVQDRNPPEPNWTHPRTPELIKALYGAVNDESVVLSQRAADLWSEHCLVVKAAKDLQSHAKLVKAHVLGLMGNAAVGIMPDGQTELIRSKISKKEYTVKATEYITLRERKVKPDGE